MIDLASLDTTAACDKPAEIELKHPVTGEGLGQYISVVGKDSTIFRNAIRKTVDEEERKAILARKRGKEPERKSISQREADAIDLLVACTTGFRCVEITKASTGDNVATSFDYLNFKGQLVYSAENAKTLYTEQVWIRAQIDEAIGNLENFMPG